MADKHCKKCGEAKPPTEFPRHRRRKDGLSDWCKVCHRDHSAKYQRENPEKARESQRKYRETHPEKIAEWQSTRNNRQVNLKARFDMTQEQYEELLRLQGGGCAICGSTKVEAGRNNLHIDHCYETKHVRGILCCNCNRGIGMFADSPEKLERAAAYLRSAASTPTGFKVRVDFLDRRRTRS